MPVGWFAMGLLFIAFAAMPLRSQSHLYAWKADYVGHFFGTAVASAGDVNADGYDDVITGTGWDTKKFKSGDGARVFSGRDGSLLFSVQVPAFPSVAVAGAGDLDRDGHADVVVWAWNVKAWSPELWFISGKTQKRIRTLLFKGSWGSDTLASAGDVNKDGYPDLLVGDSQYPGGGRVLVVSGKDGSFVHDLKPTNINYSSFGSSVAGAGDVDGDGYADFLVGDWLFGSYSGVIGPGRAWLYSGKTGKVLRTFSQPITLKNQGLANGGAVAGLGDLDGDGRPDQAIGVPGYDSGAKDLGQVHVFSGATGKRILTLTGLQAGESLGLSLASVGDWDLDGKADLAVGAASVNPKFPTGAGAVIIYSGKTGKRLWNLHGGYKDQNLGWALAGGGDVDGDRRPDLIVGMAEAYRAQPALTAEMSVWSPAKKSLWSDTHKVSLGKQGQQVLQLDAGAKQAGRTYFLLGSMSGIKPGLPLGGLTLPLQVDGYFWLTATVPNSSFLRSSLGVLDSKGQAKATFTAVTGMPKALIGARADHAYVVFDKTGFRMTSDWVPLLFEK